jgi:predicted acyltransferase
MARDVPLPVLETRVGPAAERATKEIAARAPASERLASLDAFRGFIMFWIIGGEGLLAGVQALGHNRVIDGIVYELNHTPWQGLRFYDCIWPSFMLLVGLSIPFSFAKRSLTQSYRQQLARALRRTVALFLLGSVRESVSLGSPYLVELSSALQPIAIAYLVAFLMARKSWKFQASVGALILASYAFLLALVPAPGIPAGTYALNHNLVHYVDIALLGQEHWNIWPYAPEGWGTVLSTIPTISTTILGLLLGELLMSGRPKQVKARLIGGIGLLCLALGYILSPFVPVIMKLWTTSYGLVTAGWACLMFLFFYWPIDVWACRKWSVPFAVIGANAIFIYMFRSLIHLGSIVGVFTQGIARLLPRSGVLAQEVAVLVVEWLILFWMYKRRIFIKA